MIVLKAAKEVPFGSQSTKCKPHSIGHEIGPGQYDIDTSISKDLKQDLFQMSLGDRKGTAPFNSTKQRLFDKILNDAKKHGWKDVLHPK